MIVKVTPDLIAGAAAELLANLSAHFSGKPVPHPLTSSDAAPNF